MVNNMMTHKGTIQSDRIGEINMTIWKGTWINWRINTRICHKNQGYRQETKSQYVFAIRYLPNLIYHYSYSKFWNRFFHSLWLQIHCSPQKSF